MAQGIMRRSRSRSRSRSRTRDLLDKPLIHKSKSHDKKVNHDGVGTKSCLAIGGGAGGGGATYPKRLPLRKPKTTRGATTTSSSSARSWNQDVELQQGFASWESFASPSTTNWHHQSKTTASAVSTSTTQPSSTEQSKQSSYTTPSPIYEAPPHPQISHLLTPPTPSDRSERRRLQYEQERRQSKTLEADDELEPQGVRGQEASITTPKATPSAMDLPIRSFADPKNPSRSSSLPPRPKSMENTLAMMRIRSTVLSNDRPDYPPQQQQRLRLVNVSPGEMSSPSNRETTVHTAGSSYRVTPNTPSATKPPRENQDPIEYISEPEDTSSSNSDDDIEQMRADLLSSSPLQFSPETGQAVLLQQPQQSQQQQRPPRPIPPSQRDTDEESTRSDDDIQYMMTDLVPSLHESPPLQTSSTVESNRSQPQHVREPSPVAAAAAAAAAASVQSKSRSNPDTAAPIEKSHDDNFDNVNELNAQAMAFVQEGQLDHALANFGHVLELNRQAHGEIHPSVASAFHNLGTVHAKRAALAMEDSILQQTCRAQALECFQAAARVARDSLGRTHPNVAVSLVRIGFLLLQSRQYHNSIITFQEALRIRTAHYGPQHGLVANLHNNIGVAQMHLGQFALGKESLERALHIQRDMVAQSVHQKRHNRWINLLELADTLFNLGGLHLEWIRRQGPDARRASDAQACFEEALEIRTKVLGPDDPMVLQVKALLDMARALPRPRNSRSISPSRSRSRSRSQGRRTTTTPDPLLTEPPTVQRTEYFGARASPSVSASVSSKKPFDESITGLSSSSVPAESVSSRKPFDESFTGLSVYDHTLQQSPGHGTSIFRSEPTGMSLSEAVNSASRSMDGAAKKLSSKATPPLPIVTVSTDEGDEDAPLSNGKSTRIYLTPHLVPETSPPRGRKGNTDDISDRVIADRSFEQHDVFTPDTSTEVLASSPVIQKVFSYDAEENCLISDVGVNSDIGRIHFNDQHEPTRRDIMVTRPYRAPAVGLNSSMSTNSDRWGSETVNFSTGNKERDDVMNRARAILQAHQDPSEPGEQKVGSDQNVSPPQRPAAQSQFDQEDDGLAPLGGSWPSHEGRSKDIRTLVENPMNHLREIHDEATRQLKLNNVVDAVRLFQIVLECQQRRHGAVHPDVAAALHNVGIAQLRALSYQDALKAFEEAARIRKGAMGKDHPQVAVSLTKAGITLLLLHRFDDALWSFREALSVRKAALGALHPSTARIYNNIGCVHVEFNEFREARRAFEAALDIQRNALCQDPDSGPLMFGAATTLCNLGYLYRYRDMHLKACLVLKEAVELQERVLGRTHATVLSTLDNLADSAANSGHASEALKYYNMILDRFRVSDRVGGLAGSKKVLRAEAILYYKMSIVFHQQRNEREAQLDNLKLALRSIRAYADSTIGGRDTEQNDALERRIQHDIREAREHLEKQQLKWI